MNHFAIDPNEISAQSTVAAVRSGKGEGPALASLLGAGERLESEALATLFLSEDVPTNELLELAAKLRRARTGKSAVETFSPLYLTNECDGECLMCGMRRFNEELRRETADAATNHRQLDLLHRRGMRGVALLTGEYHAGERRDEMFSKTRAALATRSNRVLLTS